jgi:hypothetical protein
MTKDMQKSKCYRWEWKALKHLHTPALTFDECGDLVRRASAQFGTPVPTLELKRISRIAGQARFNHITINPDYGLNAATVLHEYAHTMVYWYRKISGSGPDNYFREEAGHGAYFMALLLSLVEWYNGDDLRPAALAAGLKVAHPQLVIGPKPLDNWATYRASQPTPTAPVAPAPRPKAMIPGAKCLWCGRNGIRPEIKFCSFVQADKWMAAHGHPSLAGLTYTEAAAVVQQATAHLRWDPSVRYWVNDNTHEYQDYGSGWK